MKKIPIIIAIVAGLTVLIGIVASFDNTQISDKQVTQPTTERDATNEMYANIRGDEFDKAYLADMIAHHQGALNMASYARTETTSGRIKALCESILASQTTEVQQMLAWQKDWGYIDGADPHAGHMMEAGGGMGDAMAQMEARLYNLTGAAFDKEFLAQMVVHHQQAVDMSRYAEANAKHTELKDLAKAIISAQEKEIADMKRWQLDEGN